MQREEIGQVMRALNDQVCLIQLQLEAPSKKMHGGDGTMSEACLEELQKLRKDVRLIQVSLQHRVESLLMNDLILMGRSGIQSTPK